MEDIEIFNKRMRCKSFSGKKLSKFLAVESEFINCHFENMSIKDVCFGGGSKQTLYFGCIFDNSVFSSNAPGVARFENCSFRNIKIKKFFCVDVEMIDCTFSGEIEQGNFIGVHRDVSGEISVNEFRGNDFSDLRLGDVGFSGLDLTAQKMPVGSDFLVISNVKNFLTKVRTDCASIKNQQLSDAILRVLGIMALESEGGNNQMFVDRRSFPIDLKDAMDFIFFHANKTRENK